MIHGIVRDCYKDLFYETFKRKLSEFDDLVTGFDIIKFDDYVKTPEGKSLSEYINDKHGKEAKYMILNFIQNSISLHPKDKVFIAAGRYETKKQIKDKCKKFGVEYEVKKGE